MLHPIYPWYGKDLCVLVVGRVETDALKPTTSSRIWLKNVAAQAAFPKATCVHQQTKQADYTAKETENLPAWQPLNEKPTPNDKITTIIEVW